MGWADRMRDVIGQGLAVTQDIASKAGAAAADAAGGIGNKAAELGNKAAVFGNKAADKARDLGEKGTAGIELRKLELEAETVCARLGAEIYEQLIENRLPNVESGTPSIKPYLDKLKDLNTQIEAKEELLK